MEALLGNKRKIGTEKIESSSTSEPVSNKKAPVKKGRGSSSAKKTKSNKIHGKTLEQHRRGLGDCVKKAIVVQKYAIEAKTFVTTTTPLDVFEQLIVPNAATVTPPSFDASTPVVVASTTSRDAIGEMFGKSKIAGGNRMQTWRADKADVIYFPPSQELRVWWTMK